MRNATCSEWIGGVFGCLFHHQWVVQLLLCYIVICCGRVGDGIGADWVQSICSWVQLAIVCSWIAVLVSEIETSRGFAMLARLSKTCSFVSFNPFFELSNSCWWWKLTSSNGRCEAQTTGNPASDWSNSTQFKRLCFWRIGFIYSFIHSFMPSAAVTWNIKHGADDPGNWPNF
jgi:hypothetical protein